MMVLQMLIYCCDQRYYHCNNPFPLLGLPKPLAIVRSGKVIAIAFLKRQQTSMESNPKWFIEQLWLYYASDNAYENLKFGISQQ